MSCGSYGKNWCVEQIVLMICSSGNGFLLLLRECGRTFPLPRAQVIYFFHFRGNSERRVHVFLRHLEKLSRHFFEPKIDVSTPSGPFQQKRPKKAKKKKMSRDRKWIFPPAVGQEKDFSSRCWPGKRFFLPLSKKC